MGIARIVVTFLLLVPTIVSAQLPSFPGAEGFGKFTPGGRGGTVIEVTNLNDAGPGSFRDALNTPGPRTIIFRTGGVINLQSDLQLTEPYVYIAGQTAPGDGIVLKNFSLSTFTHDIILRGMRIRAGDDSDGAQADLRDCIAMQQGTYNVIVDHCSFSWGLDENVSMMDTTHHVTVQWSIISEALFKNRHPKGPHSMGYLIFAGCHSTSTHHNVFAHNNARNPLIMGVVNNEFVNNVIYDWGYSSEFLEDGKQLKVDIIANYWKPLTNWVGANEYPIKIDFDSTTVLGTKLYAPDNLSPNGLFFTPAQIAALGGHAVLFSVSSLMNTATGITTYSAFNAYDTVLAYAGALHPQRDIVDTRVIKDVRDSTGGIADCIYPYPMLLDSGKVHYATDTSFIYDQVGKYPAISPEGRKIVIISGKGAGQTRTGIEVVVIDSANRIVAGIIDSAWTVIPDSTSIYEIIAPCDAYIGGWPVYAGGVAPADTDHDGMPDAWETDHSLNPNDPSDRNGTTLDTSGYTNLEVYLNGFYKQNTGTSVPSIGKRENGAFAIKAYPNPFINTVSIEFKLDEEMNPEVLVFDIYGKLVKHLKTESINKGTYSLIWDGTSDAGMKLSSGVYTIEVRTKSISKFEKIMMIAGH